MIFLILRFFSDTLVFYELLRIRSIDHVRRTSGQFLWVSIYNLYPSEVYLSRTNNSAHSTDHILHFKPLLSLIPTGMKYVCIFDILFATVTISLKRYIPESPFSNYMEGEKNYIGDKNVIFDNLCILKTIFFQNINI